MSILSTLRPLAAASPMVDLAFEVAGERLPPTYAFGLEAALLATLPWLADEADAGVHPIRAPLTNFGLILSRRARLVLRLPESRVGSAQALSGQRLTIGEATLTVGAATVRPLTPFPTLRAWNVVTSADDEQGFADDITLQLDVLGVRAQPISGRRETIGDGGRQLAGFGLVLHDLSPEHSLRLQTHGLGAARRLGCGLFVHHKLIEGLGAAPD